MEELQVANVHTVQNGADPAASEQEELLTRQ